MLPNSLASGRHSSGMCNRGGANGMTCVFKVYRCLLYQPCLVSTAQVIRWVQARQLANGA